jgi:transcriptional regulator with XRE-family HTH domain
VKAEKSDPDARRRHDLAEFLRTRRNLLTPESAGISSSRRRRTPGLRREEVAFLADIGVKWYARLEMGDDVHPSVQTLLGIAKALQLTKVDIDYLFGLAGLSTPKHERADSESDVPEAISALLALLTSIPAVVTDQILTPLRWNALADAIWHWSSLPSAIERNTLVRALSDEGFFQKYAGSDFERAMRNAVGMFRRYLASGDPNPLAREIYEKIHAAPLFQELWNEQTVSDVLNEGAPIERHHPEVGVLRFHPLDLYLYRRDGIVLKLFLPADDDSIKTVARLHGLGTPNL